MIFAWISFTNHKSCFVLLLISSSWLVKVETIGEKEEYARFCTTLCQSLHAIKTCDFISSYKCTTQCYHKVLIGLTHKVHSMVWFKYWTVCTAFCFSTISLFSSLHQACPGSRTNLFQPHPFSKGTDPHPLHQSVHFPCLQSHTTRGFPIALPCRLLCHLLLEHH